MELPSSMRLLVGAATLLTLLTACRATSVTECPHKEGYDSTPDWTCSPASPSSVKSVSSLSAAEAACNANPSCVCFNSDGEVITATSSEGRYLRGCSYTKTDCPRKTGFTMLGKVQVSVGAGGSSFNAGSAAAAEAACTGNCVGWTSEGLVVNSGFVVEPAIAAPYCVYKTSGCTPKFGFDTVMGSSFEVLSDMRQGSNKGVMESAMAAEAFCKITPKCSAWNSRGEYLIGGIKNLVADSGACVYKKQPCPPVAGFTAYYGLTVDRGTHGAPASTESALCFADIKAKCAGDAKCKLFDTLRNVWRADSEPLTPFPGMCTYRKIRGV